MQTLRQLKFFFKIDYKIVGVLGRGMFIRSIGRGLFYSNAAHKTKRNRRQSKKWSLKGGEAAKKSKKKIKKSTKTKKSKKKNYTRHTVRKKRWYVYRNILRYSLSHMGERGHFFYRNPRKIFVKYQRLNAIYKRFILCSTFYNKNKMRILLRSLLRRRRFGPYKIKGLKPLGKRGVLREGKARKF